MTTTINASTSAGLVQTADTSGILQLQTANTAALTIDASQNVGIGVTPSAWQATFRGFQVGSGASISSFSTAEVSLTTNAYYGSSQFRYINTDVALKYTQNSSGHQWSSAVSGTAGNAITFTQVLGVNKGTTLALEGATSATGTGIAFPATQSASTDANTLDDYEEGDWTPVLGGSTSQSGQTYSIQQGKYIKIGKQVTLTFRIALSAKGTITGTYAQLKGFPFTIGGGSSTSGSISYYANMNAGFYWMGMYSDSNEVFAYVTANTGLVANVQILDPTNINNSTGLFGSITYNSV